MIGERRTHPEYMQILDTLLACNKLNNKDRVFCESERQARTLTVKEKSRINVLLKKYNLT